MAIVISRIHLAGVQQLARLALEDVCYIDDTSNIPEDEPKSSTIPVELKILLYLLP